MNLTKIEWVKNPDGTQGYTWNPITGCLNHTPDGLCLGGMFPCYAYKLAHGRLKQRYLANDNLAPFEKTTYRSQIEHKFDPFYPRFWTKRLRELGDAWDRRTWHKIIKGIFVCDMSDLFGIGIPEEWTRQVLSELSDTPHRFYLLTKQPQNLIKFSPFPDNCWVGVTATDTGMAYKAANNLRRVEAKVKYISFEPLLGKIINWVGDAQYLLKDLDWLIIGAQTKPTVYPKIEWVEEIVRACAEAGIPVFLKDNLYLLLGLGNGNSICHNNEIGVLRQELLNVTR